MMEQEADEEDVQPNPKRRKQAQDKGQEESEPAEMQEEQAEGRTQRTSLSFPQHVIQSSFNCT